MTGAGRLGRAFEIAFAAHAGQTDKSGQPYMAHVIRVACQVSDQHGDDEDAQIVALLHDVVEDTDVALDQIQQAFGPGIAAAVDAITHRRNEAQAAYLDRVAANAVARRVKLADLADNSDPVRMAQLDVETQARLTRKYTAAKARLAD